MKRVTLLLLPAFLIMSCNQHMPKNFAENSGSPVMEMQLAKSPIPPPAAEEGQTAVADKKKIIKDGSLGLKVTDLEKTKHRVDSLINIYGAYYANESLNNSDYQSSYNLKIRVPSENLEKLIAGIEYGKSQILYKSIDARDVTEEFIDLETRLENKKSYLAQYHTILKQARNIKDILEVEEKTRVIEEEIESTEGRIKYLNDQVNYSTLDLMISRENAYKFLPSKHIYFKEKFKQSLSGGWNGFILFFLLLIRLWPLWILLALFFSLWRRFRSVRKNKK